MYVRNIIVALLKYAIGKNVKKWLEFYTGPGSTPTSCASSPRGEEPASPHGGVSQPAFFHHQTYTRPFFTSGRRGPGRPRKEGPKLVREGKIVRR